MKKIHISLVVMLVIMCICLGGCSSYEVYENTYVNNELTPEKLSSIVSSEADASMLGNNVCIINKSMPNSVDSTIKAPVALLINRTKNKMIFSKEPYRRMYPASITKVATALMAFNKFDDLKSQTATISKEAASITEAGAKLCGFKEGDQINFYELVTAMMVYSGNDAAYAVGQHVGNTEREFCMAMTDVTTSLGASKSNFVNPHGLHNDRQYVTAYDIYMIFNKLMEYAEAKKVAGVKSIEVNYKTKSNVDKKAVFTTTNKYLLGTSKAPNGVTVLAGKTGTTNKAGSCLVLLSKDANNDEYISVILHASSSSQLYSDMTNLLKHIVNGNND